MTGVASGEGRGSASLVALSSKAIAGVGDEQHVLRELSVSEAVTAVCRARPEISPVNPSADAKSGRGADERLGSREHLGCRPGRRLAGERVSPEWTGR
jgi:hypothetical protein